MPAKCCAIVWEFDKRAYMNAFFIMHREALIGTIIVVVLLLIARFAAARTIRRIGRTNDFVEARTLLIIKYVSILSLFLAIGALLFIWRINIKDIGLLFSSAFAVIGVALFAQWSILSNITAGIVLFLSFPFKIGDRIRIMDKDLDDGTDGNGAIFTIEDIRSFHIHLRKDNGTLLTYPNNLILQKGVTLVP